MRRDILWKSNKLTKSFLTNIRGGIPFGSEQIEVMMRLIQGSKHPVEVFMDVGCGNGILAGAILRDYPRARGTLVDFSDAMLAEAKRHLRQFRSQLRFVKADFSSREWLGAVDGERFDAVVSGYAIHHQPDQRKREIFREVFGLLNPGGVFVNIEHVAPESKWIARLNDDLFVDSLYKYRSRKGQRKTRDLILKEVVHRKNKLAILAPVETQCDWLRRCGFLDVGCYFKVFGLAVFGGREPAE
ncbi:MAG: class I SAM-dependent methyltransferase [Candidatus Bathyarchaeia archaeon]